MFKKIFRSPAGHSRDFGGFQIRTSQKNSSSSSSGQDSESVSVLNPDPENRYFLRNPVDDVSSKSHSKASNDGKQTNENWDPFDVKQTLRKSKSFSFKFRKEEQPQTMPKSRSVHFADDLASYQREKIKEKQPIRKEASETETLESASSPSDEDADMETGSDSVETGPETQSSENSDKRSRHLTIDAEARVSNLESQGQFRKTRRAGEVLQSFFPEEERLGQSSTDHSPTQEEIEDLERGKTQKGVEVNYSDSTDVDSAEELPTKALSIIYPIYRQICHMTGHEHMEEAECSLSWLQQEVFNGFVALEKTGQNFRSEAIKMRAEIQKLQAQLASEEKQKRETKEAEKAWKAKIDELQDKIRKQNSMAKSAVQTHQKSMSRLSDKLTSCEQQMEQQKEQHTHTLQNLRKEMGICTKENQELSRQIRKLREKALDVDSFQISESRILSEANKRLEAAAKSHESERDRLQTQILELERQVSDHRREVTEQQKVAQEKEQQLEKFKALRAEEKSEDQVFNLELKREFKEIKEAKQALELQHEELQKVLGTQKDMNASLTQRINSAQSASESLKCENGRLTTEIRNKNMDLAAIRVSNQLAVHSLQQLIQSSYRILASRFKPESTRPFSQIYSELAKIKIIDDHNKGVVNVLLAFLQTGLCDIMQQYERNEEALGSEVENRHLFQEQVLSTFRSIVKQVVGINREKRARSPRRKNPHK